MPSKGNRAAARQAKLRQRKRRAKTSPQEFDPGPTQSQTAALERIPEVEEEPQPLAAASPSARQASRSRTARADEATPSYEFLGRELRRIGFVSALIFAILAALFFVLGS